MFVNYIPVAIKSETMFGESLDRRGLSDRLELGFGRGMKADEVDMDRRDNGNERMFLVKVIENKKLSDNLG